MLLVYMIITQVMIVLNNLVEVIKPIIFGYIIPNKDPPGAIINFRDENILRNQSIYIYYIVLVMYECLSI